MILELDKAYALFSFWRKPGILCPKLQRLIPGALWDPNRRQTLPKKFNAAAYDYLLLTINEKCS
jgi:hypothetical protein